MFSSCCTVIVARSSCAHSGTAAGAPTSSIPSATRNPVSVCAMLFAMLHDSDRVVPSRPGP